MESLGGDGAWNGTGAADRALGWGESAGWEVEGTEEEVGIHRLLARSGGRWGTGRTRT